MHYQRLRPDPAEAQEGRFVMDEMLKRLETFEARFGDYRAVACVKYDEHGFRRFACIDVYDSGDDCPCYSACFCGNDCDFKVWATYRDLVEVFSKEGEIPEGWTSSLFGDSVYSKIEPMKHVEKDRYFVFVVPGSRLMLDWDATFDSICELDGYGLACSFHCRDGKGVHVHVVVKSDGLTTAADVLDSFSDYADKVLPVRNVREMLRYIQRDGSEVRSLDVFGDFPEADEIVSESGR